MKCYRFKSGVKSNDRDRCLKIDRLTFSHPPSKNETKLFHSLIFNSRSCFPLQKTTPSGRYSSHVHYRMSPPLEPPFSLSLRAPRPGGHGDKSCDFGFVFFFIQKENQAVTFSSREYASHQGKSSHLDDHLFMSNVF